MHVQWRISNPATEYGPQNKATSKSNYMVALFLHPPHAGKSNELTYLRGAEITHRPQRSLTNINLTTHDFVSASEISRYWHG